MGGEPMAGSRGVPQVEKQWGGTRGAERRQQVDGLPASVATHFHQATLQVGVGLAVFATGSEPPPSREDLADPPPLALLQRCEQPLFELPKRVVAHPVDAERPVVPIELVDRRP